MVATGDKATKMKAAVVEEPGGPEVLKLQDRPIPTPQPGWVLIKVRAFGINRSDLFTRQGHSPSGRCEKIGTVTSAGDNVR